MPIKTVSHLSIAISIEDVDDALHERVLLQLGQRHELVDGERPAVVQVQLAESLAEPPDLVRVDCHTHTSSHTVCYVPTLATSRHSEHRGGWCTYIPSL